MSNVEELFNSLSEEEISAMTVDEATEPHIIIGADRFVAVPESLRRIAVEHDHNIETVTFDCPRYWDGHDMSEMQVYINYMRSDGYKDSYPVKSITLDSPDSDIMHFDWTISKNVTDKSGQISFLICIKETDSEGNVAIHWNSELNTQMNVSNGMDCVEQVTKENPDLVTQVLLFMDTFEVKDGSITPEKLDRKYQEYISNTTVNGYDYLDSIITEDNSDAVYRLNFSGLSGIKAIVGEGDFVGFVSKSEPNILYIQNLSNGEVWKYLKGNDTLVKKTIVTTTDISDGAVTSSKIASESVMEQHIEPYSITEQHISNKVISTRTIADGAVTSEKLSKHDLTVMVFNPNGWTGINSDINLMNSIFYKYKPDLVGFQEYHAESSIEGVNTDDYAKRICPDLAVGEYLIGQVKAANALCSNYVLTEASSTQYESQMTSTGENLRYYQKAYIYIDGVKIAVFNTRLEQTKNYSYKKAQTLEIIEACSKEENFILIGDFNTNVKSPDDEAYADFVKPFVDAGFNLANCSEKFGYMNTWTSGTTADDTSWCPTENIITSSNIHIERAFVDTQKIKANTGLVIDHLPLIANLSIHIPRYPMISITTEKIEGGNKVTITDAEGAKEFDVMDGVSLNRSQINAMNRLFERAAYVDNTIADEYDYFKNSFGLSDEGVIEILTSDDIFERVNLSHLYFVSQSTVDKYGHYLYVKLDRSCCPIWIDINPDYAYTIEFEAENTTVKVGFEQYSETQYQAVLDGVDMANAGLGGYGWQYSGYEWIPYQYFKGDTPDGTPICKARIQFNAGTVGLKKLVLSRRKYTPEE